MPSTIQDAKIALLDFPLQRHKVQMGVSVQVDDVAEVEGIRQRELDITKEKIDKLKGEFLYHLSKNKHMI